MTQALAETRALAVLGWLAGHDDLSPVFLGATGLSKDDLRALAGQAEFLAAVLDFVVQDDAWVLACCAALDWRPEEIMAIRAALPGGDLPHWT